MTQRKIGEAAVDTGMLLIIDPAYLFTEEEWMKDIGTRAKRLGDDFPTAVLEALAEITGRPIETLAVVASTGGDGRFQVTQSEERIVIE